MLQKDIERFEIFGVDGKWLIKDNEQLPNLLDCYQSCVRLNQQSQRIAELEEQLKNAIVPKFKIGQIVYIPDKYFNKIYELKITSIRISRFKDKHFNSISYDGYLEESLFATKEEAQEKLKELQGE